MLIISLAKAEEIVYNIFTCSPSDMPKGLGRGYAFWGVNTGRY